MVTMNYENVKFDDEARKKIIEGVNLITDAIEVTYGPKGNCVMIKQPNGVRVTKDGSTVATAVTSSDPYIQMGIDLIRDISKQTSDEVGDGSSTVSILAREIVNALKDKSNPIEISRQLQKEGQDYISYLNKYKKQIKSKKDLIKVATLSANNDEKIGKIIAEAYETVGKDGLVTFQEADETQDRVEFTQGFRIESGYSSPYFINTPKWTCELENVYVYISDIKMEEVKEVIKIAEEAMKQKKSLLLIAPGFDSEIYIFLKANLDLLKSCTVISPNYRNYRQIMMEDIKDILGNTLTCKRIICDSGYTTFIGYESNIDKVNNKIDSIKALLESNILGQFDSEFQKKRLANFTSGIATIYVGGYSQTEIKNKIDLYEDAVNATHQALIGGILPGGGRALLNCTQYFSNYILSTIFNKPSVILNNTEVYPHFWTGNNTKIDKIGNMYTMGIIDPFNVVKATIENSISIASQILSCKCAILNTNIQL